MATELGVGFVSIVPSMRGFGSSLSKEFGKVERQAAQAGDQAGRKMSSGITSHLKNVGKIAGGALAAVGAIGVGAVLGDAVKQAGDLEQSVGAINSVFKSQAGQMLGWAREASTAVGLSRNEYQELSTTLGALLKNGGTPLEELGEKTNDLVGLGADLASMFGGTTKDAVGALSSALKGERDPIEQYGVSLNQAKIDAEAASLGFEKVGGSLSAEATQAATLSLIMKQTSDAHGNFAKEADTFAGQQQRMGAQWADLKAKIGELFLPVLSNAMGFITGTAMPVFEEFIGGIRAFGEAWKANDGDITSSGFPGFMERVAFVARGLVDGFRSNVMPTLSAFGGFITGTVVPALAGMGEWIVKNRNWLVPLFAVVGTGVLAFQAYLGVIKLVTAAKALMVAKAVAVKAAIVTMNAVMAANPIGLVIAALAALAIGLVLAWKHSETFRAIVTGAWDGIKAAASAVAGWFTGTLVPWFQAALATVGAVFSWLYENIIRPVWDGIRIYIAVVTGVLMTLFQGVVSLVRNVLGPVFTWLYEAIIRPVFDWITARIQAFSGWFSGSLWPAIRGVVNWIGDVFRWLWNNAVKPVWDGITRHIAAFASWFSGTLLPAVRNVLQWVGDKFNWLWRNIVRPVWTSISDKISGVWTFLRDRVFNPLIDVVQNKVGAAFSKAKDAVKTAWDKIQDIVKKPVKFVIDTVINGALIKNINKVLGTFGMDKIAEVSSGFYDGGYTGNIDPHKAAGVVHGDEHVIRSKSRRDIERKNPGLLDAMNRFGSSALFGHEGHAAHGGAAAGGPGGPGTYLWGPLQDRIYASGVAHVNGHAPGFDLRSAARAWNNMSNLRVKYGNGQNQISVGAGAPPGTWGYAWTNGRIQLNPGIPAGMKTGTAAHEIGHVLGLDHAGTNSIMHPMMRGPLWPSAFDRASIQRIYGGSGKGNPPEGGGDGGSWWNPISLVMSGVEKILDTITNKFDGLPGQLALGAGKYVFNKGKDWVTSIWDDPVGTVQPLRPGVSTIYNGTGSTEYFQRVQPGGGSGSGNTYNIQALDLDEALRKLRREEMRREALYAV